MYKSTRSYSPHRYRCHHFGTDLENNHQRLHKEINSNQCDDDESNENNTGMVGMICFNQNNLLYVNLVDSLPPDSHFKNIHIFFYHFFSFISIIIDLLNAAVPSSMQVSQFFFCSVQLNCICQQTPDLTDILQFAT